jgi:hypothetical protein
MSSRRTRNLVDLLMFYQGVCYIPTTSKYTSISSVLGADEPPPPPWLTGTVISSSSVTAHSPPISPSSCLHTHADFAGPECSVHFFDNNDSTTIHAAVSTPALCAEHCGHVIPDHSDLATRKLCRLSCGHSHSSFAGSDCALVCGHTHDNFLSQCPAHKSLLPGKAPGISSSSRRA